MSDRNHPSESELLRHFLSSVEDYEALEAALPLPRSVKVLGSVDEGTRWRTALHAMLLRKYFEGDRLDVVKVVRAMQACASDDSVSPERWRSLERIVSTPGDSMIEYHFGDHPVSYSEAELATADLYGRLLHGDYGKWRTSELAKGGGMQSAVLMVTTDRADRLTAIARLVRESVEEGKTVLDPSA
jgi:hypothetical protein